MQAIPSSLLVSSPAKVNLFLNVLYKRPDGYHELETLFERISLADTIRLSRIKSNKILVYSQSRDIPLDRRNLAFQAARLIKNTYRINAGIRIDIEKNIPVGAGLGGGSSNAASVLLGLNRLFGLKADRKFLIDCANRLGSDVAFFVFGRRFAVGRGRGGDLKGVSVAKSLKLWHILFVPRIKVITKDVYGLLDRESDIPSQALLPLGSLKLTKKMYDVNILLSLLRKGRVSALNRYIYNRLSVTVIKSYSLVSALMSDLSQLGLFRVHMSGSGPTLFATFKTRQEAQRALGQLSQFSDRCRMFLVCSR